MADLSASVVLCGLVLTIFLVVVPTSAPTARFSRCLERKNRTGARLASLAEFLRLLRGSLHALGNLQGFFQGLLSLAKPSRSFRCAFHRPNGPEALQRGTCRTYISSPNGVSWPGNRRSILQGFGFSGRNETFHGDRFRVVVFYTE